MFQYIIKRIIIFLPTLLVISLLTFSISAFAPGDPIKEMLTSQTGDGGQSGKGQASEKAYMELRKKFNLDLPIFYFSTSTLANTDTLHRIAKKPHRENLKRLVSQSGNWPAVEDYYEALRDFEVAVYSTEKDTDNAAALIKLKDNAKDLLVSYDPDKIKDKFTLIPNLVAKASSLQGIQPAYDKVVNKYETIQSNKTTWKNYIPAFHFYGLKNQYHRWFFGDKPLFGDGDGKWASKGFIRGDFGTSYKDQRPVANVLVDAVSITFKISLFIIFLTYLFSIPLGIVSAVKRGTVFDQISTTVLFILYSLPGFWLATLGVIYICGGDGLSIFPPAYKPDFTGGFFKDVSQWIYYVSLPLFIMTLGSMAYLSRQMRGGVINVFGQDYIRTARSKGLSEKSVVLKHALRNSLLPIITLFASVFPAAIGGSIIMETIFSIPGMGKMAFEAVVSRNYPIVYATVMFSSILTLVGYLVADVLYALVDPRISYK